MENAQQELSRITLDWDAPEQCGEIEVPTLDIMVGESEIRKAARRAFWSLVHAGYGDIDEVKVFYKGEQVAGAGPDGLPL